MAFKPAYYYKQSAVIPYIAGSSGIKVFLISSRKQKRWIVPKGIVEEGLSSGESAMKEAFEEAGIKGKLLPEPLGSYEYEKWNGVCSVEVFAMEVDNILPDWEEKSFRKRAVVDLDEAVGMVSGDLRPMMMKFRLTMIHREGL